MTKEGLIELRNKLQKVKQEEHYNLVQCFKTYDDNYQIVYFKDKNMIIELAKYNKWQNELEALNYLEASIEESLCNAYKNKNDVKQITSKIMVYFFSPSKFIEELKYNEYASFISETFNKNDLFNPFVLIGFCYYVDNLYDKQPENYKSFIVDYNEFSKIVKRHGFEISIDNYDDLLENHIKGERPEIILNFEKEKVKTK